MHAEVIDALLLSGRLTVAEAAALTLAELETVAALSGELIDLGQEAQAIRVAGALCALFPYEPAYWAVFARALDASGATAQAAVARSVVHVFAGDDETPGDERESAAVTATHVPMPTPLPLDESTATGVAHAGITATGITTNVTQTGVTETAATATREVTVTGRHEITQTARLFLGANAPETHDVVTTELPGDEPQTTARHSRGPQPRTREDTITATALVPRKVAATARRLSELPSAEDTARVDRRFLRSAQRARPRRRATLTEKTAIVRRRLGLELSSVAAPEPEHEEAP